MKKISFTIIISLLFIKTYSQSVELKNLDIELIRGVDFYENGTHTIKGKPSKVTYRNYSYDKLQEIYVETLSVFLNYYRNSVYEFDSLGRIRKRSLEKYGNFKGLETYAYKTLDNSNNSVFMKRYWWKEEGDQTSEKRLDIIYREIYQGDLLLKRFAYQSSIDFIYREHNLIEVIERMYEKPLEYDEYGTILNLDDNPVKSSETLFTCKYDDQNRRIEKKEINTEYITYITKYMYDEKSRLLYNIKITYKENVLSYFTVKEYEYNDRDDVIRLTEYDQTAFYDPEPPAGNGEAYIKSHLDLIESNKTIGDKIHEYTYQYDQNGNWTEKTFYERNPHWADDIPSRSKLSRIIEY